MKSNKLLSLIPAGFLVYSLANAQEPVSVPIDSSLVQTQAVEAVNTNQPTTTLEQAAIQHAIQYSGQDSLYNELPMRETTVPGLTDKQKRKLLKKFPEGIEVNPRAFSLRVEGETTALDVIDYAIADVLARGNLTSEEQDFIQYEGYRIRKNMDEIVKGYNQMAEDGRLTVPELDNLLQTKYSFQLADNNRLKEAFPKDDDAYKLIVEAQETFNQYVSRVTGFTQRKLEEALKTPWYKSMKFVIPTAAITATAGYWAGTRGKGGKTGKVEGSRNGGPGVY